MVSSSFAFITLPVAIVKYEKCPIPEQVYDVESLSILINNMDYDYEKANKLNNGILDYTTDVNYPYQTLINKKGICSDYALLNYVLLKKLGYEVKILAFEHQKGAWHSVAIFKQNDKWYVIEHKTGIIDLEWYYNNNIVRGYVYTNDKYFSSKPFDKYEEVI